MRWNLNFKGGVQIYYRNLRMGNCFKYSSLEKMKLPEKTDKIEVIPPSDKPISSLP